MKECRDCSTEKKEEEFYKANNADGLQSWCKVCHRKRMKNWELKNPDKVKENWKRGNYKKSKKTCEICNNDYVAQGKETGCSTRCRILFHIIKKESGCWEWNMSYGSDGYGQIVLNKKRRSVHRVSYEIFKGKIPVKLCVLHSCDNRKCLNPDHLFLGTHKDNMQDMLRKGRGRYQKSKDIQNGREKEMDTKCNQT